MNKELEQFVQQWMDGHEEDTFIKNEHGNVIYSAGPTSLNLTAYFVNLLEDYQESVTPKMISVEAVKEYLTEQEKHSLEMCKVAKENRDIFLEGISTGECVAFSLVSAFITSTT